MFANEIMPILIRLIRRFFIRWQDWILILAAIILMQPSAPTRFLYHHGALICQNQTQ